MSVRYPPTGFSAEAKEHLHRRDTSQYVACVFELESAKHRVQKGRLEVVSPNVESSKRPISTARKNRPPAVGKSHAQAAIGTDSVAECAIDTVVPEDPLIVSTRASSCPANA